MMGGQRKGPDYAK